MTSTFSLRAREHPIKSVTVFKSSKAEVVRTFAVNLKTGRNKVEIRNLPGTIDTRSVRVSGLGNARLFDIVCTIATGSASEVIRTLRVKRGTLESEKQVREQGADLLLKYAQTLKGEHVDPTQMGLFLESYVEQARKNLKARTELSEQIIQIDRQIEAENEKARGSTLGRAEIVIVTDQEISVELKLTYIVSNAQWTPTYELHATTENGKPSCSVNLHYRARVTQSTGEDWNNTSLTLSTVASDTVVKRIPQLRAIRLCPPQHEIKLRPDDVKWDPPESWVHQAQSASSRAAADANVASQKVIKSRDIYKRRTRGSVPREVDVESSDDEEFEKIDESGPDPIMEPKTIISETPMAISFSIHGESTIPSDGIYHQVSVAILAFEAKISYITIPRINPRVFLQCEVENSSEYRLLPGPVTVILDDSYVSKTSINDVNTGDNFECTLGDDASTKVTYSRTFNTVKSVGGAFSEVSNTTTYTTKISIHNKHQFDINDLVVRDVIPTCDAADKRAIVVLRKPAKLADAKDGETVEVVEGEGLRVGWEKLVDGKGGEKEGKFEWKWKVGNGAKVDLEAEWEVKVPGEVAWVEE